MTEADEDSIDRWVAEAAIQVGVDGGAFQSNEHGLLGLHEGLRAAIQSTSDEPTIQFLALLERVAQYWLRPENWNEPYGPMIALQGRRTGIPSDLSDDDVMRLLQIAPLIPEPLLRARAFDVLFLNAVPRERANFAIEYIQAVLDSGIEDDTWALNVDAWRRAVLLARRLGKPTRALLNKLEGELRAAIRRKQGGFVALRAAELLRSNSIGREHSGAVAGRLAQIAGSDRDKDRARAYRKAAAGWFRWAGDDGSAYKQIEFIVRSLIHDAEELAAVTGEANVGTAAHLFELALQELRSLPRTVRAELLLDDLPSFLARRIRESGAAQLGRMRAFTSEAVDLSVAIEDSRNRVKDLDTSVALRALVSLIELADVEQEEANARKVLSEHPLQSLFSTVTYSSDGRIIYRSGGQGGTPIYGTDPTVWRQMIRTFDMRIGLYVQGVIWPAYEQISNEHHLAIEDFEVIAEVASIVPGDRVRSYARGLYYGYCGDFASAVQLLVPQIENLVRFHLNNAGISTTTIEAGIEHEIGLTSLMEREEVEQILGKDLCFEIKALFCGPLGPNLRNELAHGLLGDSLASSATSVYAWWFALRLVYIPFWNMMHDVAAAEAREPQPPNEGEREPTVREGPSTDENPE